MKVFFFSYRENPFAVFVNERGSVSSQWRGISGHSCFPKNPSLLTSPLKALFSGSAFFGGLDLSSSVSDYPGRGDFCFPGVWE